MGQQFNEKIEENGLTVLAQFWYYYWHFSYDFGGWIYRNNVNHKNTNQSRGDYNLKLYHVPNVHIGQFWVHFSLFSLRTFSIVVILLYIMVFESFPFTLYTKVESALFLSPFS